MFLLGIRANQSGLLFVRQERQISSRGGGGVVGGLNPGDGPAMEDYCGRAVGLISRLSTLYIPIRLLPTPMLAAAAAVVCLR